LTRCTRIPRSTFFRHVRLFVVSTFINYSGTQCTNAWIDDVWKCLCCRSVITDHTGIQIMLSVSILTFYLRPLVNSWRRLRSAESTLLSMHILSSVQYSFMLVFYALLQLLRDSGLL